jgi:type I site-specific restriction-modification system R (restriction) subunit/very-short-patch-repair endonuclease
MRITEHSIEDFAIKLLEHLGYEYIYAPNIAPEFPSDGGVAAAGGRGGIFPSSGGVPAAGGRGGIFPSSGGVPAAGGRGGIFPSSGGVPAAGGRGGQDQRTSYEEILLTHRLAEAVRRINPTVPPAAQEEAIKEIQRIHSPELLTNNESFHRLLTEGIKVSYQKDGQQRGDLVWLIDFNTPENNDFIVANQFTVVEDGVNKRPDVILFVNGIPLVVIELKNAADENATIKSAFRQIETYKAVIPSLFTYNAFTIISDGLEARAGTLSSGMSRFMAWKSADGKEEASHLVSQMETLINGMLNKETLLDLVRHFIVFEKSKKEDSKTGVTTISTVKKLAAYHQYYAVNRAVESAMRATGYSPSLKGWHQPAADDGVVNSPSLKGWHQPAADDGVVNSPSLKGWHQPAADDGVVNSPSLKGWHQPAADDGVVNSPSLKGWHQPAADDGVVNSPSLKGWHQPAADDGVVNSPSLKGWHQPAADDGVVNSPSLKGWHQPAADDGVVNSPSLKGWHQPAADDGVVNSPSLKGWHRPEGDDGVVKRTSKNYFSLPYNPKLKDRARELRKAGNLPEVLFWNEVKNKQFKGYDFDRQKIIGNYIVDFYCSNCQVVIEIDGSSHDDKVEYDAERDAFLESLGLTVIHIPVNDIMKQISSVMNMLHEHPALAGTKESPHPPAVGTPPEEGDFVQESPESYGVAGVKSQPKGDRKGGVVWHTQGSGKSLSMVFFTGKIVLALNNPTVVVITDRNDLDDQLFDTFASSTQLLRQEPKQIENRNDLKEKLKVASGGVIFTTIQKFSPEEGNVYETLSERENIVVIADEAHRTQYGFKAKTVDEKDEQGNVIGKKTVYGFAKYMRDALPNATYIGFTGTPIESTDVNTPAVFGNYIDVYDIAQAVEDGATVRIYYESRLAKVNLSEEGKKLVEELDDELDGEELTETQKAKAKWTQLEALIGSENRIKNVANDIIQHFGQRQEVFEGKGMIVAMSRRIAADLYGEIIKLKPEWHSADLDKGVIKVVMTAASSDGEKIAKHHTTKQQRRMLADRMKDPDDELKLVIVRDMWLTGFDAPSMHTLYIDKPMKGHNLMQAIARVNRVYKDKPGGLVVDYLGIASDLKKALSFYSDAGGKGDPTIAQAQAVELMLEKLEVVSQMYSEFPSVGGVSATGGRGGFPYEDYFQAETGQKLSMILAAEEHILGLEDGKKRYINEVTALSKAFAIAVPHEQAMDVKDEVSFFQAVKARLAKFDGTGSSRTDEEIETTIRQVIDQALVSEQVIDVFDAAGIKKPDISILSEDFLMELKGMEHKNVALEVLKKLLNDEIIARSKKNLVKGKSLKEMLENSIKKYHNRILSAAEVMDELIKLSKEIVNMDSEAKKLGLSDFEYAFYTAVANNDSAKQLMQQDKLRELAVILTERVKQNASIDWTIKESVRAKLKVIIKRTLRQYGYPPDMQKLATETVLKQAEMIANELSN